MESIKEIKAHPNSIRQRSRALLVLSLITVVSTGMATNARAQTFEEWFSQKKTQKKYLLQQIAALQVYSTYLKQGYGIATNGLGSISGYLKSENSMHSTYYTRLNNADPVVKNNAMVKDILAWQQDILQRTQAMNGTKLMTSSEKSYVASVGKAVLADCDRQLSKLQDVTGDNKIQMSDAERLALIEQIHKAMLNNYRFTSAFSAQIKLLAVKRQEEQEQIAGSKRIYGIN